MPEDDKYDVLEKIGHGSFGVIRKVRRKADGYILCRKEISYSKMSQKEKEQLQAELSILKELRHPNIVAYFERDHIKMSQDLHLYMEYCGNGDLGRVIRKLKDKNEFADEEFVWSIMSQITGALYRCHYGEDPPPAGQNVMGLGQNAKPGQGNGRPMILHRDLKPENIFLGEDNSVKLGDFGLSKILQSHDFASTYVGTPFYMSPEICKAEQYTHFSDIWALGCIIYEMCAREPPFNAKTHFELIQKIKLGRYPDIPKCYTADLRRVIASCLQVVPNMRPDTAQLLNLPAVKLMRKEQEVVKVANDMKEQKDRARRMMEEAERKLAEVEQMRKELDSGLRREWEVKARLEIDRQIKILHDAELARLKDLFEVEVNKRVEQMLVRHPSRFSTSPRLAPRSNTPTMPATQDALFPTTDAIITASTSTLGSDSSFASGTDISSLSLEDTSEPPQEGQRSKSSHQERSSVQPTEKPAPTKKTRRAPLARAQTMFTAAAQVPPSPMDIQMGEPSPAPASIAGLSLSPRKRTSKLNIFAAAKDNAKKWEPEIPSSPTEDDWTRDFEDDDDDDLPVLPSPTRARSASGGRNGSSHGDPLKNHTATQRPILKPTQRLASAPSLAPNGTKARPASAVPVVATSPARTKSRTDLLSPSRKTAALKTAEPSGSTGFKSKKGNDHIRMQAMHNNGVRGRTLVELQQARGIPVQTRSEDDVTMKGRLNFGMGTRSPAKARSANANQPAVWDPDTEPDMPSPFIVRSKRMVK